MEILKSIARTNEVNGTAIRILKFYTDIATPAADTYLKDLMNRLTSLSAQMTDAINMGRAQSDLDEADLVRDGAVRSLFISVQGFTVQKNPAVRESAQRIQGILENYGLKMIRENYTTESSLIKALLADLDSPESLVDIANLSGVDELVQDIRDAENDFLTKQTAFEKSTSEHKNIVSPTKLKPQILSLINNDIVLHLHSRKKSDPAKYTELADAVAQTITDTNSAIKHRANAGKSANKSDKKA